MSKPLRLDLTTLVGFFGACAGVAALISRWLWMTSLQYPISTDGFYYLHQIRSWAELGHGYYSSSSPFFPMLGAFSALTGASPSLTYYLSVVTVVLFTAFTLASLARIRWHYAVWLLPIVCASDLIFFQIYAFPRQWAALGCIVLSLSLLLSTEQSPTQQKKYLSGLLTAAVGSWCHAFAGIVACILLSGLFLSEGRKRKSLLIVAGTALISTSVYLLLQQKEFLATTLSVEDWGFIRACTLIKCSPLEKFEFYFWVLSGVLGLTGSLFSIKFNTARAARPLILTSLGLLVGLNLPFWTSEGQMATRLAYASPWVTLMGLSLCTHFATKAESVILPRSIRLALILALCAFSSAFFILPHKDPPQRGPDPSLLEAHASTLRDWIPANALIQAPHGVQFEVAYFLGRNSTSVIIGRSAREDVFRLTQNQPRKGLACVDIQELTSVGTNAVSCVMLNKDWAFLKAK